MNLKIYNFISAALFGMPYSVRDVLITQAKKWAWHDQKIHIFTFVTRFHWFQVHGQINFKGIYS